MRVPAEPSADRWTTTPARGGGSITTSMSATVPGASPGRASRRRRPRPRPARRPARAARRPRAFLGQDRLGHQPRPAVDRAQGRGGVVIAPATARWAPPRRTPSSTSRRWRPVVAGGLVPGAGGVEVGALVDPGARAGLVGPEGGAVELADEVPGARAAVLRPAVQVDDQHPTLVVAVEGQREQVGHLTRPSSTPRPTSDKGCQSSRSPDRNSLTTRASATTAAITQ